LPYLVTVTALPLLREAKKAGRVGNECQEMARTRTSFCAMGKRKECGGNGGRVKCNCHDVGASTAVRWSRRESSRSKEGHDGEGSAVTCSKTSMVWVAKCVWQVIEI